MSRKYWSGFAAGAAAGVGAGLGGIALASALQKGSRIVRLEKSIQIGRPPHEVFQQWANIERLPRWSDCIEDITRMGERSHWRVKVDGQTLEWDAKIEQFLPNQALGWKSVEGPKHTGRITFSPIGSDTLVQVTMNYAPPSRLLNPFAANLGQILERYLEQVLRDFKASLEGKGQEGVKPAIRSSGEKLAATGPKRPTEIKRATGTDVSVPDKAETPGTGTSPVDYTSPPEAKR